MYNSLKDAKDNHPSLSVFLRDTVHIGITSESHRFPNTFVLVFTDRSPLFLASKNEFTVRWDIFLFIYLFFLNLNEKVNEYEDA